MQTSVDRSPLSRTTTVSVTISDEEAASLGRAAMVMAAKLIAERIAKEGWPEVAKALDPKVVASLVAEEAASRAAGMVQRQQPRELPQVHVTVRPHLSLL